MLYSVKITYAVRIIDALKEGNHMTLDEICEAYRVPKAWGYKIAKQLHKAGFVSIKRGRFGGYSLDRNLRDYTMWDLVTTVETDMEVYSCISGPCPLGKDKESCALYRDVVEIQIGMEKLLNEKSMYETLFR